MCVAACVKCLQNAGLDRTFEGVASLQAHGNDAESSSLHETAYMQRQTINTDTSDHRMADQWVTCAHLVKKNVFQDNIFY